MWTRDVAPALSILLGRLVEKLEAELSGTTLRSEMEAGNRGGAMSATQQPSMHDRERSSGPGNTVAPTNQLTCPT